VPAVVETGIWQNQQYLLLEWLEAAPPAQGYWERFGAALAYMHAKPQTSFGWPSNNFIGSLPQVNSAHFHFLGSGNTFGKKWGIGKGVFEFVITGRIA
jgi:fructosamine-3-kinase